MSWYRIFLVINEDGYPKIKYEAIFKRILSRVYRLEKEHIDILSRVYPNIIIKNSQIILES